MSRARWIFILALAATLTSCGNSSIAQNPSAAPPPYELSPKKVADSPRPSKNHFLEILSVLSVEHQVDVLAQREGLVMATEKDEGSPVHAGEELARLDDSSLQAELQKAQSDLVVAENNVKYKQAEEKAKNAQLHRQQLLRQYGLSSEADLEQAQFEAKAVTYEVESWQSVVKSNEATIQQLYLQIDKTHIRAPFAGVVVHRFIRQGEQVLKDEKCFRISQLGPLEVEFQVPERSGLSPRPGVKFKLQLTDGGSENYTASVLRVSPTVDPATDSYDVVARLTGKNLAGLRPGMSVHVLWPAPVAQNPHL